MIGIYKITSPTSKVYIGQSTDVKRRFCTYKGNPTAYATSVKLHRSLVKHGAENHTFEIIEECDTDDLKRKISIVHKGKVLSQQTRDKIKIARSKQIITQAHKNKISENGSARLVLDYSTGVFFSSAKEAAHAYNLKHNSLVCVLIGKVKKNKTNLAYV